MAELLRLQRGRPVKRKGLAEKGEKRKGERIYFIRLLVSSDSIPEAIQELFQAAGIAALAFVLLLGFIFFLPTIISGLRESKPRWLICVANVVFITDFILQFRRQDTFQQGYWNGS